jgi:membrane dipeptidase
LIVDAHEDIAWNWLEFGRDPRESALDTRTRESGTWVIGSVGQRTTGLPQWIEGRVGIIFATLFVMPRSHARTASLTQVYSTPQEAYQRAVEQMGKYHELAQGDAFRLITSRQALEEVLAAWSPEHSQLPPIGLVIAMEGADPIETPAQVAEWYASGLRIVGPAWAATRYAGGTGEPGPLTELGRELLQVMSEAGLILDLSHSAEEAFLEAVDSYAGTLIASHSNPRAFLPTDRGLSDEMIRKLAGRDGVVGITPYNSYLMPDWEVGDPRSLVTVETVVRAVDYVAQLLGDVEHVGIGSDFDGGFGAASLPNGMDTIADLQQIAVALAGWGYTTEQIEAVMNGNWLRILRGALSA